MTKLFPPLKKASAQGPDQMETMQDVIDWIEAHGPPHLSGPLKTLRRNLFGASPKTLKIADFDPLFPKSVSKIHPRPDLPQKLSAYKAWREKCRRAIALATGADAEKQELRARQDGWADLLAAARLHTKDGGHIATQSMSPLTTFADVCRRADLEPWDLARPEATDRIEAVLHEKSQRRVVRDAQKVLNSFSYLPELGALLPADPVPVQPTLRDLDALPPHVDARIVELVEKAAYKRDRVAGKDAERVGNKTRNGYLAAMRHHVRALPHCRVHRDPDPEIDYPQPVTDLDSVNDIDGLFSLDHLCATIRRTAEVEHLNGTLSQGSAYKYYGTILTVLGHNELLQDKTVEVIKESDFLEMGKELSQGMRPATRQWCQQLIADPQRDRRFCNMHRLMKRDAQAILDGAKGRDLTQTEIKEVRALGTSAAASAIEFAGAPIRKGNCLGFRLHGTRQNFFQPGDKGYSTYTFYLPKEETKAGKEVTPIELSDRLHGRQVLDWYLEEIRPLFPHANDSIYLFPAIEDPTRPLGSGTFDIWFERASAACGLHMTFHKWRHGYATILLDEDWGNLKVAADMLGNTMAVCEENYAWIDKKRLHKDGQNMVANRRDRKDAEMDGVRV